MHFFLSLYHLPAFSRIFSLLKAKEAFWLYYYRDFSLIFFMETWMLMTLDTPHGPNTKFLKKCLKNAGKTLLHQQVLLIVCFINPMSVRYSTNWDRKGWLISYLNNLLSKMGLYTRHNCCALCLYWTI